MTTRLLRGHRFRLDLPAASAAEIETFTDGRRKAYNWGLALVKDVLGLETAADEELVALSGHGPSRLLDKYALITAFTKAKPSLPWATSVPSTAIEYAFEDLTASLAAFFAARKAKSRRKVGFPRFIRADDPRRCSFTVRGVIRVTDANHVRLPCLAAPLRVRGSTGRLERQIAAYGGIIREATVRRDGHDHRGHSRWSLSVVIEREAQADLDDAALRAATPIGADLGLRTLLTLSDGTSVANPRLLVARGKRLRFLTRSLARSQAARYVPTLLPAIERHREMLAEWAKLPEDQRPAKKPAFPTMPLPSKSHRQQKKEAVLGVARHRLADTRRTNHGQIAAAIIPAHLVLGIEDLATANLLQNHHLARSIADAAWASLVTSIETRAEDHGCLVLRADRFFASSQICSACGYKNPEVKDLSVTTWTCPACGAVWGRDINAAINLVPTPVQITAGLLARAEKRVAYTRSREKIARRAAATAVTKRQNKIERDERIARRAAEAAAMAATATTDTADSADTLALSDLFSPSSGAVIESLRRPDAQATLNRAWRTGQTGTSVPARSETRGSLSERSRPETRTGMGRRVRTIMPGGSP